MGKTVSGLRFEAYTFEFSMLELKPQQVKSSFLFSYRPCSENGFFGHPTDCAKCSILYAWVCYRPTLTDKNPENLALVR